MTTDANLTSDNKPVQSFDDVLEAILRTNFHHGKDGYIHMYGDASAAIKAAIREARPETTYVVAEHSDGSSIVKVNGPMREWSKNMELGE